MHSPTSAFSKRTGISATAVVRVIKPTLHVPVLGQDGLDFGAVLACGCSPVRKIGWVGGAGKLVRDVAVHSWVCFSSLVAAGACCLQGRKETCLSLPAKMHFCGVTGEGSLDLPASWQCHSVAPLILNKEGSYFTFLIIL